MINVVHKCYSGKGSEIMQEAKGNMCGQLVAFQKSTIPCLVQISSDAAIYSKLSHCRIVKFAYHVEELFGKVRVNLENVVAFGICVVGYVCLDGDEAVEAALF